MTLVGWWLLAVLAQPAAPAPAVEGAAPVELRQQAGKGEVVIGRYRLKREKTGGYRADTEVFVAHVAADGGVRFDDPLKLPGWAVWPIVAVVTSIGKATGPGGDSPGDLKKNSQNCPMVGANDEELHDSAHHAEKMDFLEKTARFRAELRQGRDQVALVRWQRRVDAIAGDRRVPASRRRQTLFQLWLECEDSPDGILARQAVEAAIRQRLPAGRPDGVRRRRAGAPEQGTAPGPAVRSLRGRTLSCAAKVEGVKASLLIAAALLLLLGLVHSVLGERYILMRLFRRDNLPRLFGSDGFTKRTLRFAWHLTTVVWLGVAVLLVRLAGAPPPGVPEIGATLAVTAGASGLVALVGSRARHPAWIVFLVVALLAWTGTR